MSLAAPSDPHGQGWRAALDERRELARRRLLDEEQGIESRLDARAGDLAERAAALDERRDEQDRHEGLRRKLAQMMAHDIKNHLAVVKSNGSFVLDEGFEGAGREALDRAVAAADRALALTAEFASIERIEGLEPACCDVDLRELFGRVADELAPLASRFGVQLTREAAGVHARLDPRLAQRVLENLVDNAIRHGGCTRVALSAELTLDGFALCVKDDGSGLPASVRQALSISAADGEALVRKQRGLDFCRSATEAQGGALSVEEVEPRGARVRLAFRTAR